MAYDNAPQELSFQFQGRALSGTVDLNGSLVDFSGSEPRESAFHRYPKRRAGRREDMNAGAKRLQVTLKFVSDDGATAAQKYQQFAVAVDTNPLGLLVHPLYGRWTAFCSGPQHRVNFAEATNLVTTTVIFDETSVDGAPPDTLSVYSATQAVSEQASAVQTASSTYAAQLARTAAIAADLSAAVTAIDSALAKFDTAVSTVDTIRETVNSAQGIGSAVVGKINAILDSTLLLANTMTSLADAATSADQFDGLTEPATAAATVLETLLGQCVAARDALVDQLIAASPTPAGAADAVGAAEEALASCYVLQASVAAERPALIDYVVTSLTDVMAIAVAFYPKSADYVTRALEIMSNNRIPNPAAIPPGTILKLYAK